MMLRAVEPEQSGDGSLSYNKRDRLAKMLIGAPVVPTMEEWGTSAEAVKNLHRAMQLYDTQRDPDG